MNYLSTKTYGHELGLSAVFRQWRADSHCNQLHGYALSFKFTFEADELDDRNWVMDFGGLKPLKEMLTEWFDHKLLIAIDDPKLAELSKLDELGLANVAIVDGVGCEKFAELAFGLAERALQMVNAHKRVRVIEVECSEHGANSAIYRT
jgi:6-pyruvoyltetrahydropterin/6-carboxytetrahydropterin synthase